MTNKEAIAILENLKIQGKALFSQRLALDLAIKALEDRPQGEWTTVKGIEGAYYCSECDGDIDWKSRYCPWCGAKMEVDYE